MLKSSCCFLSGADSCPCRQLSTLCLHARHRLISQTLTLILYHPSVSERYALTKMSSLCKSIVSSNKTRISYRQYKTASTLYSCFSASHKLISHSSLSSIHTHWFISNFIIRSILSSSLSVRQSRFGLILERCLSVTGRLVVIVWLCIAWVFMWILSKYCCFCLFIIGYRPHFDWARYTFVDDPKYVQSKPIGTWYCQ